MTVTPIRPRPDQCSECRIPLLPAYASAKPGVCSECAWMDQLRQTSEPPWPIRPEHDAARDALMLQGAAVPAGMLQEAV